MLKPPLPVVGMFCVVSKKTGFKAAPKRTVRAAEGKKLLSHAAGSDILQPLG